MVVPRIIILVKEWFIMNRPECRTYYVSFFERCKKPSRCYSCQSLGVSCPDYRHTKVKILSSLQLVC